MKAHEWFHSIKLKSVRSLIKSTAHTHVRKYGEYDIQRERPAPPVVDVRRLFDDEMGHKYTVNSKRVQLYGTPDLGRLYGIPIGTARRWYREGVLPEPYIVLNIYDDLSKLGLTKRYIGSRSLSLYQRTNRFT